LQPLETDVDIQDLFSDNRHNNSVDNDEE
jgi:hypothetical protein